MFFTTINPPALVLPSYVISVTLIKFPSPHWIENIMRAGACLFKTHNTMLCI